MTPTIGRTNFFLVEVFTVSAVAVDLPLRDGGVDGAGASVSSAVAIICLGSVQFTVRVVRLLSESGDAADSARQ